LVFVLLMSSRLSRCRIPLWRIRCAWLLAFALLWGFVAPQFAQALGQTSGAWVEICSNMGVRLVQLDSADASDAGDQQGRVDSADCPYCQRHANLALPPSPVQLPVWRLAAAPKFAQPAPRDIPITPPWRPALPRPPPSSTPA
jgi:hypothetical protein